MPTPPPLAEADESPARILLTFGGEIRCDLPPITPRQLVEPQRQGWNDEKHEIFRLKNYKTKLRPFDYHK